MKRWIVDCSFAAALFLPEKASTKVQEFFSDLADLSELHVPNLWWYELSNVLTISERRKLLKIDDIQRVITLLSSLSVETDTAGGFSFLKRLHELAYVYGLTSYDAAYLELAIRLDAGLATLDKDLMKAAMKCKVRLWNQ